MAGPRAFLTEEAIGTCTVLCTPLRGHKDKGVNKGGQTSLVDILCGVLGRRLMGFKKGSVILLQSLARGIPESFLRLPKDLGKLISDGTDCRLIE